MNIPVDSPRSLERALELLAAATPATRCLAGGTDLMVELEIGRSAPDRVIDLWALDELRGIEVEGGGLRVGALVTCRELLASPLAEARAGLLVDAARDVGAVQIRGRATLGGNLGTASPAADLVVALLALEAGVRLVSRAGQRDLAVGEFITGYRSTARRPDELIASIHLPARADGEGRAWRKVGTRRAQSIAKVVVALTLGLVGGRVQHLRAAAGSVADRPVLLPSLAAELVGEEPTPGRLASAARTAARQDVAPIDDVRSTARYRRHVLARILESALIRLTG